MEPLSDATPHRHLEMLAALADPVRRALYELVVARAPEDVSRDEAAREIGVARALAAFHLDRLTEVGLLAPVYRRLSGRSGPGAGRPAKLYRPASEELSVSLPPRRYDLMATVLVEALSEHGGHASLDDVCAVARQAGHELGRRAAAAERDWAGLAALLRTLAQQGFEPAVDEAGTVRLRNCPFAALTERFRAIVCAINLSLHHGVLEGLAAEGLEAGLEPAPNRCCVAIRATG